MTPISTLQIEEFDYDLPPERIAEYPVTPRDSSKLLIWKDGFVSERVFRNLPNLLPKDSRLICNETRVFPARLFFKKESGALIEVFCLEPVEPSDVQLSFQQHKSCVWKCFVGNARRWKSGKIYWKSPDEKTELFAELIEKQNETFIVRFSWQPEKLSFSEIIEICGNVPLPPYIHREAETSDKTRYQTVFAKEEGSVAAPTAGLHFTEDVFKKLNDNHIDIQKLVLHTGAGTFKPVSTDNVVEHVMHIEKIQISEKTIRSLLQPVSGRIVAVGTTTVRTLESLYWLGVKLLLEPESTTEFVINQWDPYQEKYQQNISVRESLSAVLRFMEQEDTEELYGTTGLMIVPGYEFKMCDTLITNFHQPKSTLLLLVSAFIGDGWKEAYRFALQHDFRFLSYGDACLFYAKES
ncbi:MAG: S-adenosylmethionine:tRNA ribosyltransferase-isomerase [Bacteroidales bacterium]|nr:S-adenosylmethionine:tRNA ribosyltransferase-isomerase [Bacteroidales bacterium]